MAANFNLATSKTIANLRFPLMLGVVLIHNVLIDPTEAARKGMHFVAFVVELLSFQIVSPCVPLFFFFSGYLFFLKFGAKFCAFDYGIQLKKRVHTLLIPYVFWNLVVLGYFAIIHKFAPSLINPDFNNVYHFSIVEWIRSFYDFPGGHSICYQFWFLRDLILAVIISPVIFVSMKYGRWCLMVMLTALYIYKPTLFPHQMMLTFFSLGAGVAILRYDFVEIATKCVIPSMILFVALVIISSLNLDWEWQKGVTTISGSIVFIWIASKFNTINRKITDSGFFIYAFHGFPSLILSKILVSVLHPNSTIAWLGSYIGCFMAIVLLSLGLYFGLKKLFPKFTAVITGGR